MNIGIEKKMFSWYGIQNFEKMKEILGGYNYLNVLTLIDFIADMVRTGYGAPDFLEINREMVPYELSCIYEAVQGEFKSASIYRFPEAEKTLRELASCSDAYLELANAVLFRSGLPMVALTVNGAPQSNPDKGEDDINYFSESGKEDLERFLDNSFSPKKDGLILELFDICSYIFTNLKLRINAEDLRKLLQDLGFVVKNMNFDGERCLCVVGVDLRNNAKAYNFTVR